jgi:hypothetical protein
MFIISSIYTYSALRMATCVDESHGPQRLYETLLSALDAHTNDYSFFLFISSIYIYLALRMATRVDESHGPQRLYETLLPALNAQTVARTRLDQVGSTHSLHFTL